MWPKVVLVLLVLLCFASLAHAQSGVSIGVSFGSRHSRIGVDLGFSSFRRGGGLSLGVGYVTSSCASYRRRERVPEYHYSGPVQPGSGLYISENGSTYVVNAGMPLPSEQ